ncbi:hypothetical protein HYDPIDRAFT_177139 [Hydnomerulius pinastri MD-312]|uniref:Uncharacterized protein n=1 Tax=Hydnomerulius pinastri MD-312 TaxID=994086 RepID=A0A0C9WBZ5_9AGAM|nr:hypothetical protein HYDPIDRAFT_177139 [Hydnomerulius pinastri MD-312]
MQSYIHNPNLARYVVQSSDVISDLRVHVLEEGSDKVSFYKERFLSDEEIIEHVVHNQTSTICWTIHRPKRGWYIRIRAPTFPPGVFIPLLPVPRSSPDFVDAALSLSCRTNVYPPPPSISEASSAKSSTDSVASDATAVHSYPPTPPAAPIIITPPSPQSINAKLDEIGPMPTKALKRAPKPTPTKITQFLLAPHSYAHVPGPQPGEQPSFISRALSIFQNHKPSHSSSFTLCPLGKQGDVQQSAGPSQPRQRLSQLIPQAPTPLLTFHDRTPVLTVRSVTGLLEIDRAEERMLGIDTSFWIAVALTYLEFLEERESYLAALSD